MTEFIGWLPSDTPVRRSILIRKTITCNAEASAAMADSIRAENGYEAIIFEIATDRNDVRLAIHNTTESRYPSGLKHLARFDFIEHRHHSASLHDALFVQNHTGKSPQRTSYSHVGWQESYWDSRPFIHLNQRKVVSIAERSCAEWRKISHDLIF